MGSREICVDDFDNPYKGLAKVSQKEKKQFIFVSQTLKQGSSFPTKTASASPLNPKALCLCLPISSSCLDLLHFDVIVHRTLARPTEARPDPLVSYSRLHNLEQCFLMGALLPSRVHPQVFVRTDSPVHHGNAGILPASCHWR